MKLGTKNVLYPIRKTSESFSNDAFISIGNGYFSNSFGNLTMASHCSPTLPDLKPKNKMKLWIFNAKHKRSGYEVH